MSVFPGPAPLGRGVVIEPNTEPPPACAAWPVVHVTDEVVADPRATADQLHDHWLRRQPVVVVLAADPQRLRAPEATDAPPWMLDPGFEFSRERLQYLVWSNNYDARGGEPIWWHGRRALRLGASSSEEADIVLPDGAPAWCDGGPRQRLAVDEAVVHRETIEAGSLTRNRDGPPAADLAPDQREAVVHDAGPARIIAPAGSGKTRVLTERLRHLVADRGYRPETVTAVAYNKRAAEELEQRTRGLSANIRTLNSLGLRIVNHAARKPKQVLEEMDVRRILESLVDVPRRQNTDPWPVYIEALSAVRLGLADPKLVEEAMPDAAGIAHAFDTYRSILADRHVVDFDEQLYLAIEVLLRDPEARAHYQRQCRHLLVDEFQDLTPAHLLLLRLLSAPAYDVFGVGDDDQVIYSYAGATPEFLIDYDRYFPGASAHALQVNYRCPPAVVDGARHLLSYNTRRIAKEVEAAPGRAGESSDLAVVRVANDEETAAAVARLREWAAGDVPWSDMAVLTRVNSALLPVQVTLVEAGIPCLTPLSRAVLGRTGIRAALAYLRIGVEPHAIRRADIAETVRRPSRRIARNVLDLLQKRPTTSIRDIRRLAEALTGNDVERVQSYADDLERVADAVRAGTTASVLRAIRVSIGLGSAMDVLDSSRGEADRSTHADDLLALEQVAALHPDPATFETWLAEMLTRPGSADGVVLSTVHKVKGREWPRVVVYGADDGLFPHRLARDVEEERRIFHVAITRARDETVVVAGKESPSPFCEELFGRAPRGVTRAGRDAASPWGDKRREDKERRRRVPAPPMAPGVVVEVGMAVTLRGGVDAQVMDMHGDGVLLTAGSARMLVPWGSEAQVDGRTVRLVRPGTVSEEAALAALRAWRTETAAREKVPAYVVFSDEHLAGIAEARPATLEEFSRCKGVGPAKLERYGDEVLAVLDHAAPPPA